METANFRNGSKVKVIDISKFDPLQMEKYLGKKGVIVGATSPHQHNFAVKLKDGNTFWFGRNEIKVCKPKRIPFDLERALAGDEVVTRKGNFTVRVISNDLNQKPYSVFALIDGKPHTYTEVGHLVKCPTKDPKDLFMKHAADKEPVKSLKNIQAIGRITRIPIGSFYINSF